MLDAIFLWPANWSPDGVLLLDMNMEGSSDIAQCFPLLHKLGLLLRYDFEAEVKPGQRPDVGCCISLEGMWGSQTR
jgi:hypothetical protein